MALLMASFLGYVLLVLIFVEFVKCYLRYKPNLIDILAVNILKIIKKIKIDE